MLVLKWVKENIHYFGGDSDNITVHGASTGGSVVHLLMMSPLSRGIVNADVLLTEVMIYSNKFCGLFSRFISQSDYTRRLCL